MVKLFLKMFILFVIFHLRGGLEVIKGSKSFKISDFERLGIAEADSILRCCSYYEFLKII